MEQLLIKDKQFLKIVGNIIIDIRLKMTNLSFEDKQEVLILNHFVNTQILSSNIINILYKLIVDRKTQYTKIKLLPYKNSWKIRNQEYLYMEEILDSIVVSSLSLNLENNISLNSICKEVL